MYPEMMVVPMREELTRLGIEELRTAADVDRAIPNQPGTTMVVVNSICGCAAGPHASRGPRRAAAFQPSGEDCSPSLPARTKMPPNARALILRDIRHLLLRLRCCATAKWST